MRHGVGSWTERSAAEAPIGAARERVVGDAVPAQADADDVRLPVARRRFVWVASVAALALGIGVVAMVSGDAGQAAPSVDAAPRLVAPATDALRKDPVVPSATTVPTSSGEAQVPIDERAAPAIPATAPTTRAAPDVRRPSTGAPTSPSPAPSPTPTVAPPIVPSVEPAPTPEAPPEVTPPAPPASPAVTTVEAGPLWNHDYALQTCPGLCADRGARWTGEWWTTVPNVMSVCQCASP